MEGSSDLGWDQSTSSRGLDACVISGGSIGLHQKNRHDSSSNSFNDAQIGQEPNERDCNIQINKQIGSSRVRWNEVGVGVNACTMELGDVSLRQWLDTPVRVIDHMECVHVFRQIVEMVDLAHSQGVVVHNVRPSCFVMSTVNRVSFIESASCSSSDSDTCEDGLNSQAVDAQCSSAPSVRGSHHQSRMDNDELTSPKIHFAEASHRGSDTSCVRSTSALPTCLSSVEEAEERNTDDSRKAELGGNVTEKVFPLKQIMIMEMSWYTCPEEVNGAPSSYSSDIYRLGVLLFELFCTFSSMEEKLRTMSNLRHRVLPPQLLLKWPKEASFCLWLLHPQPNSRPKMCEVLQSEFLSGPRDSLEEREAAIKLKEEIEEHELLLEFLLMMQQKKQEAAEKLRKMVEFLSSDVNEVTTQLSIIKEKSGSLSNPDDNDFSAFDKVENESTSHVRNEFGSRKRGRSRLVVHGTKEFNEHPAEFKEEEMRIGSQEISLSKSSRLTKNFKKLESAYFSTRGRMVEPVKKLPNKCSQIVTNCKESAMITEGITVDDLASKKDHTGSKKSKWINPFLEGLCKYLSFSKLKVKADLKQEDLLNSSNLVCSLSFDRDKEFFATAGVNRKIKIFECDMILGENRDIHYPVVEMASRSKLSSICWNSYIKSQIASSDFKGVVQVWDVTRSQVCMEMKEHERRVWSVDFSLADPTNLASGSDDRAVKLWNINQGGSVGTIKTKANVCCVQFPPDSARLLAIGSADHNIYCYDLRNTEAPLYTLNGHTKTVSYVKFLDSRTLVSASTDNSIKIWDLSMGSSRILDSSVQTFTGHTNVKISLEVFFSFCFISPYFFFNKLQVKDDGLCCDF
ncbi:Spa1-related [Thalictrum thalictroides]|uniref:Spa1-related n=1 Tax=Thalictrum thalictroides TaxID=46969 RepID=A0A7J6VI51_THATH|nr:Spa1-related [Thalictrum thalictroides]